MATLVNEAGTRVRCPCGDWVDVTLALGPARRENGAYVMPVSFDEEQFAEDFEAHVLAAPKREGHAPFVIKVDEEAGEHDG